VIFIDLEHKLPTDTDIPGWQPWVQARWDAWLAESRRLVDELAGLHAAGQLAERNALIDANSGHWTALKPWLLALSAGKCWFSDVRDLYSHYDVEHFRPKKEAKALDAAVRDGYWWLSFNYMNFRVYGNVGNRKKGGWFPLRANSLCSTYAQQCEESESAYLLDPTDIDDVNLLAFDEEGKVISLPGTSLWDRQRVAETVKRLKLNEHEALAEARRKVWTTVTRLAEDFQRAKSRCQAGVNPAAKQKVKDIARQVRDLTLSSSELSSVAKYCLLFRNDPQLIRLIP
jgi:hypothetical protein